MAEVRSIRSRMKGHWDQHLNVKALLYEMEPRLVVECGVAEGRNTDNLIRAKKDLGFRLVCIDIAMSPDFSDWITQGTIEWVTGVSYVELAKFTDPVDFCLIDTDHNYWTLHEELNALNQVTRPGAVVCMHDTVTFGKNNGTMDEGYARTSMVEAMKSVPYPRREIEEASSRGLGMVDAINQQVEAGEWEVIRSVDEAHGAVALRRL